MFNTKILMMVSAIGMGIFGIILSFLPNEIIDLFKIASHPISTIAFQLMSALFLGFALLNWMAKASVMGGIYNKPIAIGNFMHYAVGAIALIKLLFHVEIYHEILIPLTIYYSILAVGFGYVFMNNPKQKTS